MKENQEQKEAEHDQRLKESIEACKVAVDEHILALMRVGRRISELEAGAETHRPCDRKRLPSVDRRTDRQAFEDDRICGRLFDCFVISSIVEVGLFMKLLMLLMLLIW